MIGYRKCRYVAIGMLSVFFLASSSPATVMPEFGRSVQFDNSGPFPVMSRLRGKAVLVIFFQSWCPKCNEWAPKLIRQVQEAHGNNRAVLTLAIKTDGGRLADAMNYLSAKGADLRKWRVGIDVNATYYKQLTGSNKLWGYVVVGGDGNIARHGQASSHWTSGAERGRFVIASKMLLKECGKLTTVLPADRQYPPGLNGIVQCAEMGYLGKALSLATSATRRSRDREGAKKLKEDILAVIEARIKGQVDILKDETKDWGARYEAHKALAVIVKDLRTVPAAREANALLAKTRTNRAFQKEKSAEAAYLRVARKLPGASARYKLLLAKNLEEVAKRYEGTRYGKMAAEQARRIKEK